MRSTDNVLRIWGAPMEDLEPLGLRAAVQKTLESNAKTALRLADGSASTSNVITNSQIQQLLAIEGKGAKLRHLLDRTLQLQRRLTERAGSMPVSEITTQIRRFFVEVFNEEETLLDVGFDIPPFVLSFVARRQAVLVKKQAREIEWFRLN